MKKSASTPNTSSTRMFRMARSTWLPPRPEACSALPGAGWPLPSGVVNDRWRDEMSSVMWPNTGPEQLSAPLKLFWMSEFRSELDDLDAALPEAAPKAPRDDAQWERIMRDPLRLIADGTGSADFSACGSLPPASAAVVRWQKDRVVRTMGSGRMIGGGQFPSTNMLLLPQRIRPRLRLTLAGSVLPIVWAQSLDVALHGSGRGRPLPASEENH